MIPILSQVDIHAARMYTREMARLIGLELHEQAQVSMAVSSLAECLRMAPAGSPASQPGTNNQISIQVSDFGRHRLMVEFESAYAETCACIDGQMKRLQGLVDEVKAEQLPNGSIYVRVTKWSR
jgi:hypothetical protein